MWSFGCVETHGRAETIAQIGELEQVPRRRIEYRGVVLEEMDVDAVLARHPTLALVDELAHTNAPGSRNAKRYQDVEDMLRAGINVITTLNIQHLESLYDIVEQATGVQVKERIPDYVVADGRPDRERRSFGRRPARAAASRQDLSAGARPTGDGELLHGRQTDASARAGDGRDRLPPRPPPPRARAATGTPVTGSDRLMVCLSFAQPASRRHAPQSRPHRRPARCALVRRLHADPGEATEKVDAATQRAHCQQPGAGPAARRRPRWRSREPTWSTPSTAFVKEYGITHIILGRSNRPWYSHFFRQSVLETACCGPCRTWMSSLWKTPPRRKRDYHHLHGVQPLVQPQPPAQPFS